MIWFIFIQWLLASILALCVVVALFDIQEHKHRKGVTTLILYSWAEGFLFMFVLLVLLRIS